MDDFSAATGEIIAAFGESATLSSAANPSLSAVTVLVEQGVDVVSDNGMTVTKSTVISFLKSDLMVGGSSVRLASGDTLKLSSGESFELQHPINEDAALVVWHVR